MLSSITSFLPSALHLGPAQDLPRPAINSDTDDEDDGAQPQNTADVDPDAAGSHQIGRGKDKDKDKLANETFIFVRPPPSKSNHPLNLQVQLVPPNAKPPSGIATAAGEPTTPTSARSSSDGASLARTSSGRSDTSTNYYASTTSFASVSTAFSTTSSAPSSASSSHYRRTIIPLYNLQAHNVLTNVIVDAGTDAKIARFQKRGIELIDLALLEPVEVWGPKDKDGDKEARRESMRISVDEMGAIVQMPTVAVGAVPAGVSGSRKARGLVSPANGNVSAGSSAASLHSYSHTSHRGSANSTEPSSYHPSAAEALPAQVYLPQTSSQQSPAITTAPLPPKRNIFNKLFKKNTASSSSLSGAAASLQAPGSTPNAFNTSPSSPPSVPTGSSNSFSAFSLHPAPVANRIFGDKRGSDGRGTPPPPLALQPPTSPVSSSSQQATPTQAAVPRASAGVGSTGAKEEDPVSPTLTVAPSREKESYRDKGHARNSSLTAAITTPLKSTLAKNRNRLSAAVQGLSLGTGQSQGWGGSDSKNASTNRSESTSKNPSANPSPVGSNAEIGRVGSRESREAGQGKDTKGKGLMQRDASPNPSVARSSSHSQLSLEQAQLYQTKTDSHHYAQNQMHSLALSYSQSQHRDELKQQQLMLRPPVLGIQPTFVSSSSTMPPPASPNPFSALSPRAAEASDSLLVGQRALMYVWLARRWLKRRPTAGLGGAFGGVGAVGSVLGDSGSSFFGAKGKGQGQGYAGLAYGGVEVRFEWKRARGGKGTKKSRRGRHSTTAGTVESDEGSVRRRDYALIKEGARDREGSREREREKEKRTKRMSGGSFSTATVSEEGDSLAGRRARKGAGSTADEEDSDPEDSETPWVCTLKMRRSAVAVNAGAAPEVTRIKVGTLSPTPHHPKVVAMLKVPFPLPDVEVERMGVIRRKGFPIPGQGGRTRDEEEGAREPYRGLTLTAEEIKDMVCSTGLWLVVREGFGGVGRVSRKGDGWRLRA